MKKEEEYRYHAQNNWISRILEGKFGISLGNSEREILPGVTAHEISNSLFKILNIKPDKFEKVNIKLRFGQELIECVEKLELMTDFTRTEMIFVLQKVKNNKAAGVDGILPEFLKIQGLEQLFGSQCSLLEQHVLVLFPNCVGKMNVIAILKLHKNPLANIVLLFGRNFAIQKNNGLR